MSILRFGQAAILADTLVPCVQVPPAEGNTYTTDPVLPSLLKRLLPKDALPEIHQDLERFGGEVITCTFSLCTRSCMT